MHPAMPLGLDVGGIEIVDVAVLHPTMLSVWLSHIFVVFVSEAISSLQCSKFQVTNLTINKHLKNEQKDATKENKREQANRVELNKSSFHSTQANLLGQL